MINKAILIIQWYSQHNAILEKIVSQIAIIPRIVEIKLRHRIRVNIINKKRKKKKEFFYFFIYNRYPLNKMYILGDNVDTRNFNVNTINDNKCRKDDNVKVTTLNEKCTTGTNTEELLFFSNTEVQTTPCELLDYESESNDEPIQNLSVIILFDVIYYIFIFWQ